LLSALLVESAPSSVSTPCLLPAPPQQGTVAGCQCASECGASIDDGYTWDWCYTKGTCGTYSWTRLAYVDWCLYTVDASYESQTAAQKEKYLWGMAAKCTTSADWPSQAGIFVESVKTSFEDVSDVMPAARTKYIHAVGAVATVAFQPSGVPHKWTGMFSTGAQHGLLRLSTATPVDDARCLDYVLLYHACIWMDLWLRDCERMLHPLRDATFVILCVQNHVSTYFHA